MIPASLMLKLKVHCAGTLANDWVGFSKLKFLGISTNRFSGRLPARLPPSLAKLAAHGNLFQGAPSSVAGGMIAYATALHYLSCQNLHFTVLLHRSACVCYAVPVRSTVCHNQLAYAGPLPDGWAQTSTLNLITIYSMLNMKAVIPTPWGAPDAFSPGTKL